jgi:hypothetical protein
MLVFMLVQVIVKKMRIAQISYYLQPMSGGQQVDTSRNFIAIPRFPSNTPSDDVMYVVVTNESDQNTRGSVLSGGEIAGLVIGLVVALLLTIAIIVLLCCLWRRNKLKREKILEPGQKSDTSVDYSTVEADGPSEKNSLSRNKYDQDGKLITTKNIRGPNVFKPNDLGDMNSQDLPNVDINSHQGSGRGMRNGSNQDSYLGNNNMPPRNHSSQSGSYNANQQNSRNPSYQGQMPNPNRQYSNQMDVPYENQQVPRPNRKISESNSNNQNGIDGVFIQPPPPKTGPVNNKINFPSRNNSSQHSFVPDENPNLHQIVKDTGFNPNMQMHGPQNPNPNSRQPSQNQYQQQPQQRLNQDDNSNLRQIVKESGFAPPTRSNHNPVQLPQYVSDDENINLQQIIKDSGFLADDLLNSPNEQPAQKPHFKQRQPEFDQEPRQPQQRQRQPSNPNVDGGVTVVSARTPSTGNGSAQGFQVLPPTANRSNNSLQQPPRQNPQQDTRQNPQKPLLPHLSYSQRIETTSTPLQLQQPSKSLRAQNTGGMSRPAKEGSTDV